MSLFTHQYSTNTPSELNPAPEYFEAVAVCRDYVASSDKHNGQRYTQEYHDLKRAGFRFVGFVPAEQGQRFKDVVMVKPAADAANGNPQYGSDFSSFDIIPYGEDAAKLRIVFSYDWGNNFTPRVIAGDCMAEYMRTHLINIASDADRAAVAAYAETF